jgi:hypothetical protein
MCSFQFWIWFTLEELKIQFDYFVNSLFSTGLDTVFFLSQFRPVHVIYLLYYKRIGHWCIALYAFVSSSLAFITK